MIKLGGCIDDRYELTEMIGKGGAGSVYKAYDRALNRTVALKFLHQSLVESPESVGRFQREARIVSTLVHEGIVACYGWGVSELGCYLVFEFVDGVTLQDTLKQGKLDWARTCRLCIQICDVMDVAHREGVVHRDLNPKNILITRSDQGEEIAKILDFGLAGWQPRQKHNELQKLTQTGDLLGTIYYMSPEQCRGGTVDSRSDIYALGCILYQCINGEPPFVADNPVALMYLHENEDLPLAAISAAPERERKALHAICARAMYKDASLRYQSMQELKCDLKSILEGRACNISASVSPLRTWARRPFVVGLLILSVLVISIGSICICSPGSTAAYILALDSRCTAPDSTFFLYARTLADLGFNHQAHIAIQEASGKDFYDALGITRHAGAAEPRSVHETAKFVRSEIEWSRLYRRIGCVDPAGMRLKNAVVAMIEVAHTDAALSLQCRQLAHEVAVANFQDIEVAEACYALAGKFTADEDLWLTNAVSVAQRTSESTRASSLLGSIITTFLHHSAECLNDRRYEEASAFCRRAKAIARTELEELRVDGACLDIDMKLNPRQAFKQATALSSHVRAMMVRSPSDPDLQVTYLWTRLAMMRALLGYDGSTACQFADEFLLECDRLPWMDEARRQSWRTRIIIPICVHLSGDNFPGIKPWFDRWYARVNRRLLDDDFSYAEMLWGGTKAYIYAHEYAAARKLNAELETIRPKLNKNFSAMFGTLTVPPGD